MAYTAGTTTGGSGGVAYTYGVGPTVMGGYSSSQTMLAQRITPPVLMAGSSDGNAAIAALVAWFLIAALFLIVDAVANSVIGALALLVMFSGVVIATIAAIFVYRNVAAPARKQYDEKVKEYWQQVEIWRACWICLRCGHTWRVK